MFLVMLFLSGLFLCSFSSIFSAVVLIFSTIFIMVLMYWNLIPMIPLYVFSLFLLGGLYVLIGFMMMADTRDLDMVLSGNSIKEFFWGLVGVFVMLIFIHPLEKFLNLSFMEFSPIETMEWKFSSFFSGTFLFLVFFLLIYLFILHVLMKSSSSSSGFLS